MLHWRNILLALAVWGVLGCAAAVAFAAPRVCAERAEMLLRLGDRFSEAPIAVGMTNGGHLLEIITSETGSTWTAIMSASNGTSCLVAAGEDWQAREWKAPAKIGDGT